MKQIAFTWLLCILSICAYAQQITVTGTVTDAENNPLIGAAVVVVGTTDGVITDFDGKYTIKAAFGQSLNFSYVGYREQTVKVDGRSVINVKLSEGELLDEVVVCLSSHALMIRGWAAIPPSSVRLRRLHSK